MDPSGNLLASIDILILITKFPDVMKTILDGADKVKEQKKVAASLSGRIGSTSSAAKDSEGVAQSLGKVIAPLGEALQAIQSIMDNVADVPLSPPFLKKQIDL